MDALLEPKYLLNSFAFKVCTLEQVRQKAALAITTEDCETDTDCLRNVHIKLPIPQSLLLAHIQSSFLDSLFVHREMPFPVHAVVAQKYGRWYRLNTDIFVVLLEYGGRIPIAAQG